MDKVLDPTGMYWATVVEPNYSMEIMNEKSKIFIRKFYSTMAANGADGDVLDPTGHY